MAAFRAQQRDHLAKGGHLPATAGGLRQHRPDHGAEARFVGPAVDQQARQRISGVEEAHPRAALAQRPAQGGAMFRRGDDDSGAIGRQRGSDEGGHFGQQQLFVVVEPDGVAGVAVRKRGVGLDETLLV